MANLALKLCMLGGAGVGKSCLAVRFVEGQFEEKIFSTIGASFLSKTVVTAKETTYKMQIWDTAGQERFNTLARIYYRGASVIVIVFDVTNRGTFAYETRKWVRELMKNCDINDILLVLVGNKIDMSVELRQVTKEEAEEYAESLGAIYWETSAKTGFNVEKMFVGICSNVDDNERIKLKLTPSVSMRSRLSVRSHSGTQVEEEKTRCCN